MGAGGGVDAGAESGPGGQVGGGGEDGHVPAGLGDDHLRGPVEYAGQGDEQLDQVPKGRDRGVDVLVELLDRGVQVVDVGQDLVGQHSLPTASSHDRRPSGKP